MFSSDVHVTAGAAIVCLLLSALAGWLVGWLTNMFRNGHSPESLDGGLAGKLRSCADEQVRLQLENDALKTRIRFLEALEQARGTFPSQLDTEVDLSSSFSALRERNRLREELTELRRQLQEHEMASVSKNPLDNHGVADFWFDRSRTHLDATHEQIFTDRNSQQPTHK